MNKIKELHNQSMDLAERAFIARAKGNENESASLFQEALKSELAAITELEKSDRVEPTYSVLCRSAGTLALDCHQIREAEKIVTKALSQEPPPEIADELRELLEQINVRRHLVSWEDAKPQHAINQGILLFADTPQKRDELIKVLEKQDFPFAHEIELHVEAMNVIMGPMTDPLMKISGKIRKKGGKKHIILEHINPQNKVEPVEKTKGS